MTNRMTPEDIYRFEWADGVIVSACKVAVYPVILEQVKEHGIKAVMEELNKEILHGARWPQKSTSTCSNLTKQTRLSVIAEFYADHQYMVRKA